MVAKSKKILMIEDEEILSSLLQKKLKNQGYEVVLAENGEEGIKKIKEEKPDLVLLDVVMPKKGGFEVMQELNETEEFNLDKLPVVIISNSGQPVEINKALKLGVKDYLIKTEFDPQEVIKKVDKQFQEMNKK